MPSLFKVMHCLMLYICTEVYQNFFFNNSEKLQLLIKCNPVIIQNKKYILFLNFCFSIFKYNIRLYLIIFKDGN